MNTLKQIQSLQLPKISTSPIYFSEDSKKIFFQTGDCICIWRLDQCEQLQIIKASYYAIQSFHLSNDEKYLTCEDSINLIHNYFFKDSKHCCIGSKKSRAFSVLPYDNTFDINLSSKVNARIYNAYRIDLLKSKCLI